MGQERPQTFAPLVDGRAIRAEGLGGEALWALARDRLRNQLIVDHYAEHQASYGRTILGACDPEHADELSRLFARRVGVAARPVHGGQDGQVNRRYLEQFRRGELQVLIHVIGRSDCLEPLPTRALSSDGAAREAFLAQLLGAEQLPISIIEFTDDLGQEVSSRRRRGGRPAAVARLRRHAFDARGAPALIPDSPEVDESIRGLWLREGQTFGVELELTCPGFSKRVKPDLAWKGRAQALLDVLREALPPGTVAAEPWPERHAEGRNDALWNLEWDRSCGWEVTSRILRDRWGYEEVLRACLALRSGASTLGLKVNHRTGTHLHLGWLGRGARGVHRAIELVRLFEPALATLVSPSRLVRFDGCRYDTTRPNPFCRPVAALFSRKRLERVRRLDELWVLTGKERARQLTFNISPLDEIHTVEVRMHNGTLDARKILLWLSLWQQLLWCAASERVVPAVGDVAVLRPEGDILALAREFLPAGRQEAFLRRLDARRREIAARWGSHEVLASWLPCAERW